MDLYGPRYSLGGLEQSFRLLRKFNYLVTTAWIKRRYLPIELSPRFFQVIQPYLPMTYSVSGLRQTISMVGNSSHQVWMLSLFLVGFMGLGLLIYNQKMNNNKTNCSM